MSSDSATLLPTQQSVKAYVDSQVSGVDTLAEILAIGNTTGGTDISLSSSDITGTGNINITGTFVAQSTTGFATATLKADTNNTGSGGTPDLRFELGGTQKARLRVDTNDNVEIATGTSAGTTRFGIASNGDISFYEDTGTTAKFFWDASTERLGIGTTAPSGLLEISADSDDGTSAPSFLITNASTTLNDGAVVGTIEFRNSDASGTPPHTAKIQGIANASDERTTELAFSTGLVGTTTERLRITSDGSVGIGTNSPTNGNLQIGDSDTDFNIAIAGARTKFGYDSSNNSAVVQGGLTKGIIFCVNNSTFGSGEAGRFDASGNLLVGTTNASGSTAPDNSSDTNNAGLRLSGSLGFIGIGSNSQPTTYLNRIG